jgi:hypothetical protein
VRNPRFLKISCFLSALILLSCPDLTAQIGRIGAGFAFSSGTDFNYGETGNPGIVVKTWVNLNKAHTLQLTPSVTAFNRYKLETGYSILTNYMFHGDLDMQFTVFREGNVKAVAFAGGNIMYLTSDFEPVVVTGNETITDATDLAIGANLGAALELRMASKWDFYISGKYLYSSYSQFVISVQGVFYFKGRRRAYRR